MSDDDISIAEKRVYGERTNATRAYVASSMGVASVDSSDDQIGRFGLERRCVAHDIAGGAGRILVATDEDVLVGTGDGFVGGDDGDEVTDSGSGGTNDGFEGIDDGSGGADAGFEPAGFGPAVAVDVARDSFSDGSDLFAGDESGRIAVLAGETWETVGSVGTVRALDGPLIAAADGVYRITDEGEHVEPGDGLQSDVSHVGLDDVRDVARGPFAATGTGLYAREDGWNRELEGEATLVASDGDHAHAVVDGRLYERADGDWRAANAPTGAVVDVAYDRSTFAVTADGTVLLDPVTAKDGAPDWRTRSLGLTDVVGIVIP